MRYGVYLPPFGPFGDPKAIVELAVRAEAAGWDGVFLWDHVITDAMPIVDTWTTLAAIAHATNRILLGPTVTPLPRRRPWVVARQASTVSRLSGGRLILGVGLGSDESGDFSKFGEPTSTLTRAEMLTEGLDLIRAMWAGRAISHSGKHYQVDVPATEPEPHRIPIWMASSINNPRVLERAATCDGIFPNPADQELVAGLGKHQDIIVGGNASPAWEEEIAVDLPALAAAGMTWWLESLIHFDPLELSMKIVDAGPPRLS